LAEVSLQGVELRIPEAAVVRDPFRRARQRLGGEAAAVDPALARPREQAGVLEDAEVLGDRGQGDGEGLGQLGDRRLALRETGQQRAARGIGERPERRVEGQRLAHARLPPVS
jgi:hypothetical protein